MEANSKPEEINKLQKRIEDKVQSALAAMSRTSENAPVGRRLVA